MNWFNKRYSRREAISTTAKVAAGVVIAGGVGAFAGYYAGMTTATPAVKTETKTIQAAAQTVTYTTREVMTRTVMAGAPPIGPVEITFACDAGHNYLPWFDSKEAPSGGHYGQNQAPKIKDVLGISLAGEEIDPGTEFSIYIADLTGPGRYNIIVYFPTYNGDILGGGWAIPLDEYIAKYHVNLDDLPPRI
jgi:hypothetical protein